ncbi:hypothetical protein L7H23_10120 [Sphingopyxis sp. BSN-002]|uniref:hypothetical protein n=1 Tax=Sphingopyxis sp. BSN-002 TaxID=2911495 RepID=UPI001EDB3BF9|nr:hypothetical protein [Sphingopyxis sp. BSN-002]UKK82926.1 hypothetical protein L7H23_10120 [Sphingopyxis sp. BSN-002]
MADRLPPSRYSVVERGGRLVVIDRDTGQTPPSAAERMAEYDRRMGNERAQPTGRVTVVEPEAAPTPIEPAAPMRPETRPPNPRMAAAVAEMNRKRPWKEPARASAAKPEPARIAQRPQPKAQASAGGRKTIVTGKWWDSKGPRTIELGPKGQQTLSGGFVTLFFVALIAAIVALLIAPVILFVVGFLLFRFGGNILGPIGAGIVDKALAERN